MPAVHSSRLCDDDDVVMVSSDDDLEDNVEIVPTISPRHGHPDDRFFISWRSTAPSG